MTKKLIKSKLIMEKTKKTKLYSNATIRMLPKPSPNNTRKKIVFNVCKNEASKTSVSYNVKQNHYDFQLNKGRANKNIGVGEC